MLCNHSAYSFTYGTTPLRELVERAVGEGDRELALTDINSSAGVVEFVRLAKEAGIRPVAGMDLRNGNERCFVALARNNAGFEELNRFLSEHHMAKRALPPEAEFNEVFVIYPMDRVPARKLRDNEYIGIAPGQLPKLRFAACRHERGRLVILHSNTFRHQKDLNAHRLLRSVSLNTLLSKLPAEEQGTREDFYLSRSSLKALFAEFPHVVANTERLLAACSIDFELKNYLQTQNQRVWTPGGTHADDREKLRSLCREGLEYRYGRQAGPEVLQRLENELEVLEKRNYYSYFLINWDIVRFARRHDYYYVGRGSGANSLVAYLLRITDVDPIKLDLYFERFMNMSRQQPPDFDVDFSWRDRQQVTQYIFSRYPKAALLGAHNTFKHRAIARELGKVLGLPPRDIDQLSNWRSNPVQLDKLQQLALKYGALIEGLPHNMTVHSSGILIPEKSIYHFSATFLPPKGFATTHFDMYSAEDAGLYKFDILGQRGLGKIKDTVQIVKQNQAAAKDFDIHNTAPFFADRKIKRLLRSGKTMACFYIESPAMRSLLKKLRGETYTSLVAASSIIRPGVAKSGMMGEYVRRFRDPALRQYIHPKLGEILSETYGVMVYQEDVLKVAHHFAGLTLEESDILRRGMSWKFKERNRFDEVREKFFANCRSFGYPDSVTCEVWRQIESFGNFAFAKGHSASYAVESYQSLYLKAYYPLEYMVATINNGGGFYNTETYLNEARLHGAIIEAPCINQSERETIIRGKTIFLGYQLMRDLEEATVDKIMRERAQNGPFATLQDFTDRVEISLEQLVILIRINAFRSIGTDKKKLLWEAHFIMGDRKKTAPVYDLFRTPVARPEIPPLEYSPHESAIDEMEILGFPLSSPFLLVAKPVKDTVAARDLEKFRGREVSVCGYLVHVKNVITRSAKPQKMQFGCFLDANGDFIDTVHFPSVAATYRFQGPGVYHLKGKVIEEYDFYSLETTFMERLPYVDFHGG